MWRILYFLFAVLQLSNAAYLRLYDTSLSTYDVTPLDEATNILKSPYYNSSCFNMFYTYGYGGNNGGRSVNTTIDALLCFKKRISFGENTAELPAFTLICLNVFLFDWMKEASSTSVFGDIGVKARYASSAVPAAIALGKQLGAEFLKMAKIDFFLTKTHLIGFSLGAHLFGQTGLYVNENGDGTMIYRITGLDPAGPLFQGPLSLQGLDKTCASFVVTFHGDPGGYAINESLAHVDVWPNFNNFITGTEKDHVQPGCPIGDFDFMSLEDLCSHDRPWQLNAETLTLTNTLLASKAENQSAWNAGITTTVIALDNIDRNARGDFFLVTNGAAPYGKGSAGLSP